MAWHFRDTMRPARFFQFDARLSFFIVLLLVHARVWTFLLFFFVLAVFWILERKGLSFPVTLRSLRVWLIGSERPAFIYTKKRKLIDTGS